MSCYSKKNQVYWDNPQKYIIKNFNYYKGMDNLWNNEYRIDDRFKKYKVETEGSFHSKALNLQKTNANTYIRRYQQRLVHNCRKTERQLLMLNCSQKISQNENSQIAKAIYKNEPFLSKSFYLTKFKGFRDLKISNSKTSSIIDFSQAPNKCLNILINPQIIKYDKEAYENIIKRYLKESKQYNLKRLWYIKNRSEDKIRIQNQHRKVSDLSFISGQKKDETRNTMAHNSKSNPKYLEEIELDYSNFKLPNEKLEMEIEKSSDFSGLITIDFKNEVQRLENSANKIRKRINNDFKSLPMAKSFYYEKYSEMCDNYKELKNKRLKNSSSTSQNPREKKELNESIELINEFERKQKNSSALNKKKINKALY